MNAAQRLNFMRVTDNWMSPEYRPGDLLHLQPSAPCEVGHQVLIRTVKGGLVTGRPTTRGDGMATQQPSETDPEWELLYDTQIVSVARVIPGSGMCRERLVKARRRGRERHPGTAH
jgi:hypothetical protein